MATSLGSPGKCNAVKWNILFWFSKASKHNNLPLKECMKY